MSKTTMTAALALALAAATPLYAQTTAPAPATTRMPAMGTTVQPDQMRASKWMGSSVYDVQNRNIGSIKDIILDRDGRVAEVVLDVGSFLGMGGKYVAVALSDFKTDNNRLTLDRTKEQLQQAAAFQLEDRNTGAGSSTGPVTGGRTGSGH